MRGGASISTHRALSLAELAPAKREGAIEDLIVERIERVAAHEKFLVEDVRRWTESRFGVALPTERTAVFGVSAGGELAGAAVTSRLALCRVRFRAHTLSPAHRSRSSSRTQGGGRTRCAMQMRMSP